MYRAMDMDQNRTFYCMAINIELKIKSYPARRKSEIDLQDTGIGLPRDPQLLL